ncbi:cyclic di-GMP receptor LapD [Pseudomonas sp. SLFW]|uniref:cyclic di-GMP receptor LapD n=1 Tax=Pseudomonas sp. SLFW TaxID=2683259 RepID=UPI00141334DC|nr:EAL domain-containing protein [Pseudomonas sp. SLFW]NBB10739.1 EAL domain-containing protein [Pseudomonas sp. SLFW]
MTLFKQLLLAICVFMLVAFSGGFMVSLESSRDQYVNQLRSHAQDAATALALSLTPSVDDPTMMDLMVSSIFDSGYYARIRVVNPATGKILVERSAVPAATAPDWFIELIALQPAGASAIVSRGWRPAARVEVVSHPMFAIGKLWQSALGNLGWLLLCGVVSFLLGAWLLRRQLRPLDYLVEQSQAIGRREFLSVPQLPMTPELRRVVQAMNQMVDKLKALFLEQAERTEKLRMESYEDSLTGLANRRYFDMRLHAHVSQVEDARSGYLLLMRVNDLTGLNERLGSQKADALLVAVSDVLVRQCFNHAEARQLISRIRGGEFAVLAPGLVKEEALQLAYELETALCSLAGTGASDVSPAAYIGLAPYSPGDSAQTLLGLGDQALSQAETQTDCIWYCIEHSAVESLEDDHHAWYELLDQALTERRFQLFFQPVMDARDVSRVLHFKVLSRVIDDESQTLPAGRFLPWIERFGWSARHDRVMLETVFDQLPRHDQKLALNLSAATLSDAGALNEVMDLLKRHAHLAPRLILEIGEEQVPDQQALEALTRRLKDLGYSLALQHFGGRFSMIGNLSSLGLAYLKIDGSYIRAIDQERHKRLFIEAIQRAAHSIDLPLIAERVETEGEFVVLREMGIQGVQGQLFGDPAPWE